MKTLLLDQGLPRSTVWHLTELSVSSIHVSTIGMSTAVDAEILQKAREDKAVVVTLDSDFHKLLAIENAETPSVIRIRIEGLKGSDVANLIKQVVKTSEAELEIGAAVTVTERGIRIRKLPLT